MAQDKITLSWTRDGVEVAASATYSDNERTDGHWACEITRPAHVDYKSSTQLGVLQELEDMVDLTHDDLEREREAKATQTTQAPA